MNTPKTSDFSFRKYTHVILEKSSMKSMKYLLFPCDGVLIGPQTSVCISSNRSFALHAPLVEKGNRCCLPRRHPSHTSLFSFMLGRSLIMFFSCNNFKACELKWPNLRCHSHESSTCTFMAMFVAYFKFRRKLLLLLFIFTWAISDLLFCCLRFCIHLLQSEVCSLSPSFGQCLEDFLLG